MVENNIDTTEHSGVFVSSKDLLKQALNINLIVNAGMAKGENIPSGYKDIDEVTGGFANGELITIAVRPGIGKTAFMLSLLDRIAVYNEYAVGIFSAERSAKKIYTRLIESSTGLSVNKINSGRMTDSQKNQVMPAIKTLANANICIDDSSNITAEEIIERSKTLVENGINIIFIDYLELLTSSFKSKDKACNKEPLCPIINHLKAMAAELNIPVVLFSQLAKPIIYNNRFKYTPDFINEVSDTLMFLNRPDYYHINDIDGKEKGLAEITVAKTRISSDFSVVKLRFSESLDKYMDFL